MNLFFSGPTGPSNSVNLMRIELFKVFKSLLNFIIKRLNVCDIVININPSFEYAILVHSL